MAPYSEPDDFRVNFHAELARQSLTEWDVANRLLAPWGLVNQLTALHRLKMMRRHGATEDDVRDVCRVLGVPMDRLTIAREKLEAAVREARERVRELEKAHEDAEFYRRLKS